MHWSKPGGRKLRESWPAWNLELDLVTTANRSRGTLNLYRLYTERTLLLDINLLTCGFPAVLAEALDRVLMTREEALLGQQTTGKDFMAAEAG